MLVAVSSSLRALPFRRSLTTCFLLESVKLVYMVLPSLIFSSQLLD
jgi:hypothetical protein